MEKNKVIKQEYKIGSHSGKNRQRGVALVAVLLVLLLVTGIAVGLMFLTITETGIDSNFRSIQVVYFGAKAGVEEARDRMMTSNASSISGVLPTVVPSTTGGVLYLLNEGNAPGSVQPWIASNAYVDDELCHDGYSITGLQAQSSVSPDIPCTTLPSGTTWYKTVTSTAPWNGTAAALPYKWVRIAVKLNGSVQNYLVHPSLSATLPACWDGTEEVVPKTPATTCSGMSPAASSIYLVTSLAVSNNGARKMIQAEIALTPTAIFPFGLFATGTGCGAVTMSGSSSTDSFTSANGGTYATTHSNSEGSIGSNGNVNLSGSALVGGSIGVPIATTGACPAGLTTSGTAGMVAGQTPTNVLMAAGPYTIAAPPVPSPLPPTTANSYSTSTSIVPGTFGNINVDGGATLTLAPGVYKINSLVVSHGAVITISPAGVIVFNVAGQGIATVMDFTGGGGGGISNSSGIATNFQINYAGTGAITLSGGAGTYATVNAPNAAISLIGGSSFYGAIAGATITVSNSTAFHFDKSIGTGTPSNSNYNSISFRELSY